VQYKQHRQVRGPGNSVGIATGYGLDGPGIESRWRLNFPHLETGPGAHPASCKMGTGSFPGVKSGRGVTLTPYPLLVPWSRKGRSIPLFPLWAVRPVQSLSAFTAVHFTFTFTKNVPCGRSLNLRRVKWVSFFFFSQSNLVNSTFVHALNQNNLIKCWQGSQPVTLFVCTVFCGFPNN